MKRAVSPDALASDPIDRYWVGSSHLVWCRDATLCGAIWWGRSSARDLDELTRALELARHPALADGFDVLVDNRAIEHIDWALIPQLLAYVRARLDDWKTRVRRQAIAIRPGLGATVLESTAALLGMPYPQRFVDDIDAAVDWLGWSSRLDALEAVNEAAALARQAMSVSAIVQRLQSWLESSIENATVDQAAAALGVSSRTLQRELRDAGTSFTSEVRRARMRVACQLLVETDHKVEVIAREVGCSSASQLSTLFKRCVGDTPARYRERRR